MRIDVFLNPRARAANGPLIERRLKRALFRCDTRFHTPTSVEDMRSILLSPGMEQSECIVVCGGDGTLNAALTPLMSLRERNGATPPLCVLPCGTANDLATEMGLSARIERVSQSILEGRSAEVDVLEVRSPSGNAYMITNGGVGIAAETALRANALRNWISTSLEKAAIPPARRLGLELLSRAVRGAGSRLYEGLLASELLRWQADRWQVEVELPGRETFVTNAPFILINNQPSLGANFRPAPFTSNRDGVFNVLMVLPTRIVPQLKAILELRGGSLPGAGICGSYETRTLKLRARPGSRPMTFFGDGEILHRDAEEIEVRCLHPGIRITLQPEHE
jgi:diacylglycerol kinase family enzyme